MGVLALRARASPQKLRTLSPKRGLVRHSLVVPERLAWDHWIPERAAFCQLVVENVGSKMQQADLKIVKGSEVFSIAASSKQLLLAPGMRHSCKVPQNLTFPLAAAGATSTLRLPVTGAAKYAYVSIKEEMLHFGDVLVGTQSRRDFLLRNPGPVPAEWRIELVADDLSPRSCFSFSQSK
ncbi:hypothetical protein WJX84_004068 [Apatococcus fuscideae]|uniref:Uncharacterized protein n=1 Tax=Apatococcus fuscideae TaxID=2026836 RepID=A0AAW1SSV2_9CHLO